MLLPYLLVVRQTGNVAAPGLASWKIFPSLTVKM